MAARVRFQPGCGCCESCTFFSDTFTRDDDTDIGSDWTEVAGDWAISGNALRITTTSAVALCNTEHPSAESNLGLTVTLRGSAVDDQARIIIDYQDSDNYLFVRVTFGTSKLFSLNSRVAGVNSLLAGVNTTVATGTSHTFFVCVDDAGIFHAIRTSSGGGSLGAAATVTGGGAFALGSGTTVTGDIDFESIEAERMGVVPCDMCSVPCNFCDSGTTPTQYQIVVSGIVDDDCVTCSGLNATYILTQGGDVAFGSCTYSYVFPSAICTSFTAIVLSITASSYSVQFRFGGFFHISFLLGSLANPRDCSEPNSLDIPFNSNNGFTACDGTGATCLLTAL